MATIEIEGIKIHYEVQGEGEPLVFLHGGTGDSLSYWSNQVPVFSREFRVITMDHRGYGRSDKQEIEYSPKVSAQDLNILLDKLGVEKAHIVGLSLGGMIAQQFALDHSHRLKKLILADTGSGVRTEKLRLFIDTTITLAEKLGMEYMFDFNLLFAFSEKFLCENKEILENQKKAWIKTPVGPFVQILKGVKNWDVTDQLSRIKAQTLIIWGDEDIELPKVYTDILSQNIPYSRTVLIEGSGHKSCADKPHEFNRVVMEFLKEPQI